MISKLKEISLFQLRQHSLGVTPEDFVLPLSTLSMLWDKSPDFVEKGLVDYVDAL